MCVSVQINRPARAAARSFEVIVVRDVATRLGLLSCVSIVFLCAPDHALHAQGLPATGGFIEPATSTAIRALAASDAATALPLRGTFTFPAPYGTTGVRLTNGSDCGGRDCVLPVGYGYWSSLTGVTGYLSAYDADRSVNYQKYRYGALTAQTLTISYLFDTFPGCSGGGVYRSINGSRYCVGVNNWQYSNRNQGVRITAQRFNDISAWIASGS